MLESGLKQMVFSRCADDTDGGYRLKKNNRYMYLTDVYNIYDSDGGYRLKKNSR